MGSTEFLERLNEHIENGDMAAICVAYPCGRIYTSGVIDDFEFYQDHMSLSIANFILENTMHPEIQHEETIDGDVYLFKYHSNESSTEVTEVVITFV